MITLGMKFGEGQLSIGDRFLWSVNGPIYRLTSVSPDGCHLEEDVRFPERRITINEQGYTCELKIGIEWMNYLKNYRDVDSKERLVSLRGAYRG